MVKQHGSHCYHQFAWCIRECRDQQSSACECEKRSWMCRADVPCPWPCRKTLTLPWTEGGPRRFSQKQKDGSTLYTKQIPTTLVNAVFTRTGSGPGSPYLSIYRRASFIVEEARGHQLLVIGSWSLRPHQVGWSTEHRIATKPKATPRA